MALENSSATAQDMRTYPMPGPIEDTINAEIAASVKEHVLSEAASRAKFVAFAYAYAQVIMLIFLVPIIVVAVSIARHYWNMP